MLKEERIPMKIHPITAVSILALMIAVQAQAAGVSAAGIAGQAAISSSASTRDAGGDIKAFLVRKGPDPKLEPILIRRDSTAHGVIGATIVNGKGAKLATVKDIIMNADGKAILIVLSDDGMLGIGNKVAAFDYDKVVALQPDGRVLMTLSQRMIDHASDFSYNPAKWAKAKVIPAGSVSTNALLKGNVLDSGGKKIATVENISFHRAEASRLIVGFDKTFGFAGKLAALDFEDLKMVRKDATVDFQLTSGQTAQFNSFRKSAAN